MKKRSETRVGKRRRREERKERTQDGKELNEQNRSEENVEKQEPLSTATETCNDVVVLQKG